VSSAAVEVRGLSKSFVVPQHRAWTLKERMRHPLLSMRHDHLQALSDIDLAIPPGEFFAIVGRNGSGKSTLLRCIAGIHPPDSGSVEVHARVAPFIELGVGFHPQLAAADNVTVAGTLMGLRPAEARRRFPSVIAFAELEQFVEMPIANYSSGMQVRLAFATSFQVDAEVLLFDEVLAVGDALFQRKCIDTFERLIDRGHTIVYVSHSLDTIRRFADRVLLLDEGRMIALGDPEAVLEEYERRNRARERSTAQADSEATVAPSAESGHGPGADTVLHPLRRFVDITTAMARAEFKLRYLDSLIGYAWALAQPLLMFVVLYEVWTKVLHSSATHVAHYPLTLLLGLALFTFFSEGTGHALPSLVAKGTMLRKIPFPAVAVPVSSVMTSAIVYSISLAIALVFILASGATPDLSWLEIFPLLAMLFLFTTGVALVVSLLYVWIRDVAPIWVVTSRLLFFVTPIFYPVELAPSGLRQAMLVNPLAIVIVQARHVLIDRSSPSAAAAAGGPAAVVVSVVLTFGILGAGLLLYRRWSPRVAERI
jgi:ABC-type polysaccharide/polyol phosphate transport system ATPase subunit/ABC-type polysaccharide/polyol phosphate export permease